MDHRSALSKIKRFDQLTAYLRNEMGWPIDRGDFEDLTFEYTPGELGIDPKNAAKIQEIKRLRPLSPNQPWGIFFIKFEPKQLPVVALRRILGQVALKKRASANRSERAAWAADDLLFISNYGEGDQRQISFAHFSDAEDGTDLPTLKVLGWDNLDTSLHLDAVAKELTENLAWPTDEEDVEAWRQSWRGAFTLRHRQVVTTSKQLSIRLAELARAIRDRIRAGLAIESERGQLTKLMTAFQESLVHDLDADGFADMYAQTIAYGLLSARIANPHKKTVDDFAGHMRTNPFLRELMETFLKIGGRRGKAGGPGIDFDELGVNEVVRLLDDANMEAVVLDFGDKNPQEDPVIHFYELFLKEYDAEKRMQRGVFYTPRPVVSYIARSVNELLRTELGLEDGLADTATWGEMVKRHQGLKIPEGIASDHAFVQILDPATGTGTFLVEVIDIIHKTMAAKWKAQDHGEKKIASLWNEYVPRHLLPRLHAYELLMAPYAIAHLKVGLKLYETGYRFGSEERARIYLTNALEPASEVQLTLGLLPALAHEAQAVNKIKRNNRFTVVIGNPPYSNFGQLNRIPFILGLLEDYKRGLDEKKINLDDDFIKFIRFSQYLLDTTGVGVFGMITNNSFLDGVTHRKMRHSLGLSYHRMAILNLHGSATLGETSPDGSPDENVFEIRQGVGITLCTKREPRLNDPVSLEYADLWGTQRSKYDTLGRIAVTASTTTSLPFQPPYFFFIPKDFGNRDEYERGVSLKEIFQEHNTGIQTKRDSLTIQFDREGLRQALTDLSSLSESALRARYSLPEDGRDWQVSAAKADVGRKFDEDRIRRILYRPFDWRWTYFTGRTKGFLAYPRRETSKHMLQENLAVVTLRINGSGDEFVMLVTNGLIEKGSLPRGNYSFFPLYLYSDNQGTQPGLGLKCERQPNLSPSFTHKIGAKLSLPAEGSGRVPGAGMSPEDIFHYAYAVFHSPSYRSRYAEFLKIDFPRLPLTENTELFRTLAGLGGGLTALHLLQSRTLDEPITQFIGGRNPEVEKISWSRNTVWVDKAQTTGFKGVPNAVWTFHIGGYQVCEKWLKDRKGRTLSKNDIAHYQKIVVALNETISLMKEIDVVIENHGGWPAAFAASAGTDEVSDGPSDNGVATDGGGWDVGAPQHQLFEPEQLPLRRVAEKSQTVHKTGPGSATDDPHPVSPRGQDQTEAMCQVRQLFSGGKSLDRSTAVAELAPQLEHQPAGSSKTEAADAAIRAAVRRGILQNASGSLRIAAGSIEHIERTVLKDQFLASLGGNRWAERDVAIRDFARWLGFRRTGATIDEVARSVINGLIREGRLESEGTQIRRAR